MLKRRNLVTLIAGTFLVVSSAMAQFADRNIKFTNGVNEDHPVGVGVKKMQEVLAAKTGGKMKITAFWGGAAGGDLPATQALRAGTQEMVCTSSSPLVGIIKELGVFDLPFLFANEKEADAVLDGAAGRYFNAKLEAAGLVNLAYWENGWRAFTNNKRPVNKPEDLKGLKIRSTPNPYHIQAFKLLGMNPSPMPIAELYTALETGTFDAQEHPINVTWSSKFYEVQKHLTVSNHVYSPLIVAMNKGKFDSLPANYQTIVVEAAREAAKYQRSLNASNAGKVVADLKKSGMQVIENVDMAPFQKIVSAEIAKTFGEKNGPALLQAIENTK